MTGGTSKASGETLAAFYERIGAHNLAPLWEVIHKLVARTPVVLQAELYAVAALAGGGVVALAEVFALPREPAMAVGAAACFGLRYMAIRHGWHLPSAHLPEDHG